TAWIDCRRTGLRGESAAMTDMHDRTARSVFAGLTPSPAARAAMQQTEADARRRKRQGVMSTMPIVLAGAMVGMNLTGPVDAATAGPKRPVSPKPALSPTAQAAKELAAAQAAQAAAIAAAASTAVPASYVVKAGDTVSGIAARYGVSTASVLALN